MTAISERFYSSEEGGVNGYFVRVVYHLFLGISFLEVAYTDRTKAALQRVAGVVLHTPLSYEKSSGIVTFSIPGYTAAEIQQRLLQEKVLVSPFEQDGAMMVLQGARHDFRGARAAPVHEDGKMKIEVSVAPSRA